MRESIAFGPECSIDVATSTVKTIHNMAGAVLRCASDGFHLNHSIATWVNQQALRQSSDEITMATMNQATAFGLNWDYKQATGAIRFMFFITESE